MGGEESGTERIEGLSGYELLIEPQDSAALEEAIEAIGRPVDFIRGDVNADAAVNVTDAIHLLSFLFHQGLRPECLDAADADRDGQLRPEDAHFLLDLLLLGGASPPPPVPRLAGRSGEGCGRPLEAGTGDLGCDSFPPCSGGSEPGVAAPVEAPPAVTECPNLHAAEGNRETAVRASPKSRMCGSPRSSTRMFVIVRTTGNGAISLICAVGERQFEWMLGARGNTTYGCFSKQNPLAAWAGGKGTAGFSYFSYRNETLQTTFTAEPDSAPALQELVRELAEWRLTEYLDRAGTQTAGLLSAVSSHLQ